MCGCLSEKKKTKQNIFLTTDGKQIEWFKTSDLKQFSIMI